MKKKSRIQEIKEGLSTRRRKFSGRLRPYGPKPQLPTKNAVRLSTVPATADEKFGGGKGEE